MSDNVSITQGSGTTIASDDISGIMHQRVKIVSGIDGVSDGDISSSYPLPVRIVSRTVSASTFTRPANTTTYAFGDLVADTTTAGSVTPLSFSTSLKSGESARVTGVKLFKSGTSITSAIFRVHLYSTSPTVTNGDNGAWLSGSYSSYLGAVDVTIDRAFSDGSAGIGQPSIGYFPVVKPSSGSIIYGLIEARSAYAPSSGETFTAVLECE